MSLIKNLKSGSVPCSEPGNSTPPDTKINLDFGHIDSQALIQKQSNAVSQVQVRGKGGTIKP
ncbi:MAG TPA: hypothetical protein VGF75_07130 [Candidatus Saccharimonadales bacterium]